ncbi:hypothetical protein PRZ48_007499 [Zasmidium cellare]|uniref:Uncharacterized protein n=1 Tax=Zasmidium cellare TaxID=395010 RepID=A0ABR0EKK6_ZASCE|nr:hypothetical protein PRZ48_007499 [Zasmidium cellare]
MEVTEADLVDRQLSQILEPDLPRTNAGKNIRKMLEGDETLLQQLSLELEVAQNKDQSWAVPRLVIGKVKDSASSRPTKDEPTWYGLFVRSGTSDRDPVQACICRMKKDKTEAWILESGEEETTTDKDVQRGIFDERLAVSYWHKRESDGSGKKTAAYLDAGVQKGQVPYLYGRFLVRLWASKLPTARIPTRHIAVKEINSAGSKRARESIGEDEPTSAKKRRCEEAGSICSPQARMEDDEDDEEVQVEVKTEDDEKAESGRKAEDDEEVEVEVKIEADKKAEDDKEVKAEDTAETETEYERLSRECGWREDRQWWRAYTNRDKRLKFTDLDNKTICEKIGSGLLLYMWKEQAGPCPIPMPGQQLLRDAMQWAERQGPDKVCHFTPCMQQWRRNGEPKYQPEITAGTLARFQTPDFWNRYWTAHKEARPRGKAKIPGLDCLS